MSLFHALALALLLSAPPDLEQIVRERAAAHGVSGDWAVQIVGCESHWNVYAVGSQGELGLAQLHPRGELLEFRARGFTDAFDPWQVADYLASRLSEGAARAWACARW